MQATKLMTIVLAGTVVGGCAAGSHRASLRSIPDTHMIFNPERTAPARPDNFRTDWPMALSGQPGGEEIEFRETIYDRQGLFGRDSDYYYLPPFPLR